MISIAQTASDLNSALTSTVKITTKPQQHQAALTGRILQDDGWHVCFMHDWGSVGISITNAIDRLATAIYREARALAEQAAASDGMRGWLRQRRTVWAKKAILVPERFHFYQHTPPKSDTGLRERFDRVALEFLDDQYRKPTWSAYRAIPKGVQSARFDCALDASLSGDRPNTPRALTTTAGP